MKFIWTLSILSLVGTCATPKYSSRIENIKDSITIVDSTLVKKYAATITPQDLKLQLYQFASREFEGRKTGEPGQKKAAEFLQNFYKKRDIASALGGENYFQNIPKSFFDESLGVKENIGATENVLAYIEGSEKPEEILILSAHLDHEGIENGEVYYGADDNGSGTVAILEIAEAFKIAKDNGHQPKRSILFLHCTAEEVGILGSEFYVKHPVFPLENTIANLNIDMIGRIDDRHLTDKNYIYLIGSDRHSKELHYISEAVSNTYSDLDLDYKYNSLDDYNQYYSRSDHYNFAKQNVPVIFYFNGEHEDYTKATDTPDKIDYKLMTKRTQLIFATAWQLVNQETRVLVDENNMFLN